MGDAQATEGERQKGPGKPKLPEDVDDLTSLPEDKPAEPAGSAASSAKIKGDVPAAAKSPPPIPKVPAAAAPPVSDVRGDALGRDLVTDLESAAPVSKQPATMRQKLRSTSEWDSVLLLVGGASLGVLLVVGAFLYLALTRGAAEDLFAAAEQSYAEEAYSTAIQRYDKYLDDYSSHEKAGMARVRREIARLRQVYREPDRGLKVASEILPKIEKEEEFAEARAELASMLPQIARGFVDQALVAKDPREQEAKIKLTRDAMKLVDNPSYVPTTLRRSQLTTIAQVNEDVDRVQRMINEERRLVETVNAITTAVSSGDTQLAYTVRARVCWRNTPGSKPMNRCERPR